MTDDEYVRQLTARAIAMATAAMAEPDSTDLTGRIAASYIVDGVPEVELVMGLMNLITALLVRLERATGRDALVELRSLAAVYGER